MAHSSVVKTYIDAHPRPPTLEDWLIPVSGQTRQVEFSRRSFKLELIECRLWCFVENRGSISAVSEMPDSRSAFEVAFAKILPLLPKGTE